MKLVIEQSGVKRVLEGSFMLCISRADAEHLRKQLLQCCSEEHHFGWVSIAGREVGTPNTEPLPWAAPHRIPIRFERPVDA